MGMNDDIQRQVAQRAEADGVLARKRAAAAEIQRITAERAAKSPLNVQSSAQGAQDLYRKALGNADRGYSAGQIGRQDLSQSTNLLHQAALGQGPSAATSQMNAGLAQASQQGQALAAGGRGAERGALRLQALQGASERAAVGAQQAGALRAQEMQTAQGQYASALQGQGQLNLQADSENEAAQRGAFDSTANAQTGFLGAANQGLGNQIDASKVSYEDALQRYKIDAQKKAEQDEAKRKNKNKYLRMGTTILGGAIGSLGGPGGTMAGATAGGALGGAVFKD